MKAFPSCLLVMIIPAATLAAMAQTTAAPSHASPQGAPAQAPAATASVARPGDVDTPEHVIDALYDVISGPAGKRDWDRFRSLFYPGARLMPSGKPPQGVAGVRVLSPEDYVARGQAVFDKEGFFERSIANRIEIWDRIAHVWSTYESRHAKEDPKPFARGINSIQLFNDGARWWVLSVYWEAEDATHQLPEQYQHYSAR